MTLLIVSTLVTLVVLPLAALLWLVCRSGSLVLWGLKTAAILAFGAALYALGPWHMLSVHGREVWIVLLVGVGVAGAWRMRGRPVWSRPAGWGWLGAGMAVLVLVGSAYALGEVYRAHEVPEAPVALASPFRDGPIYVASGGSRPLPNPHMRVAVPELERWRGQQWALDLVALYPSGNRAQGLYPTALDRYAVFGMPVHAPCNGPVRAAVDTLPDLTPPARDTTHKAGNYVLLQCDPAAYVLLAHLQSGSVRVAAGDTVSTQTRIGAVGNSGNSWEPHLHLHAQRQPGTATLLDADPRPLTLNGAFPLRNDVLHPAPPPER